MSENGFFDNELSRRDAMKTAVKAGAYAAPVVLAASVPGMGVAAASAVPTSTATSTPTVTPPNITVSARSTGTLTAGTLSEAVTLSISGAIPGKIYNVFVAPSLVGTVATATTPPSFTVGSNGSGSFAGTAVFTGPFNTLPGTEVISLVDAVTGITDYRITLTSGNGLSSTGTQNQLTFDGVVARQ